MAKNKEINILNDTSFKKLLNLNDYTDTHPAFRANLKIEIKSGGYSSYQSEYPHNMISKQGNVLSPISNLLNRDAQQKFYIF